MVNIVPFEHEFEMKSILETKIPLTMFYDRLKDISWHGENIYKTQFRSEKKTKRRVNGDPRDLEICPVLDLLSSSWDKIYIGDKDTVIDVL